MRYHGIEYDGGEGIGYFHFGILHLLGSVGGSFDFAVKKFQDCFWKFDNVAEDIGKDFEEYTLCKKKEKQLKDPNDNTDATQHVLRASIDATQHAMSDIPIYLDYMIINLCIQADCIAHEIYRFYDKDESIVHNNFKEHYKWFTETRPDYDPDYTKILKFKSDWFETLAGDKGLREIIIHDFGTYALMGQESKSVPGKTDWKFSLVNRDGYVYDNVMKTLREVIESYYYFLDLIFEHFSKKLSVKNGEEYTPPQTEKTRYYQFSSDSYLPRFWVYPQIT